MRSVGVTLLFALLFAALCAYTLYAAPAKIVASIKTNLVTALEQDNLSALAVELNGCDVTLSGEVSTQERKERAIALARVIPGVRIVMTNIQVVEPISDFNNQKSLLPKAKVEELRLGPIDPELLKDPAVQELLKESLPEQ